MSRIDYQKDKASKKVYVPHYAKIAPSKIKAAGVAVLLINEIKKYDDTIPFVLSVEDHLVKYLKASKKQIEVLQSILDNLKNNE